MDSRTRQTLNAIDDANRNDPRVWTYGAEGEPEPYELVYSKKLYAWVEALCPDPSEELILAARGLHIERWKIPRSDYPMTRKSYHDWRDALRKLHADKAGEIMRKTGYEAGTVHRTQELILRSTYPEDPESRIIEDAVSLLFLETQFTELAEKTERKKMTRILRRVWPKMTVKAQEAALQLNYTNFEKGLLEEALES